MSVPNHRYFILNKPHKMVSQFIGEDSVDMLGCIDFDFPEGIHAVGRLDSHSEGLLLLTTNKKVTRLLFQGETPHKRTYLVRVNNQITAEQLAAMRTGVSIRVRGGGFYTTPPVEIEIIDQPTNLFEHQLELRPYVAHTWFSITLYEGKYHQIRKMVSAINHRCQRLIRTSIEDLELGTLEPGGVKELTEQEFFGKLKIRYGEQ